MKMCLILLALAGATLTVTKTTNWAGAGPDRETERFINQMIAGERASDVEALRRMGTAAMPPLLKALSQPDSKFECAYTHFRSSLPQTLQDHISESLARDVVLNVSLRLSVIFFGHAPES